MFFKIGVPKNTEHLWLLLLSMLLFINVSSFTSPLPHFRYFLTVLLLSSFEETLSSLYHYYSIITIIIAEWLIRIAATATTYCTAISIIVMRISALMEFMLKRKKTKTYEWSITEKCSFIQACNFINLSRMYDFSKFCFKLDKADADILKKYIQTDLKNDLVTAI